MVTSVFHVQPKYQPLMRAVGLDGDAVFDHPQIVAWRRLKDRENCTLDAEMNKRPIRLHIKRYLHSAKAAADEVAALDLLRQADIGSVPLVGWGTSEDCRSFVITEDLAGHRAADKMIEAGTPFDRLLEPTADLAAKLHRAGLHHRDLYLCHFFASVEGEPDVRLIDAARVKRLGGMFTRNRWIVKDLAQFWYSTMSLGITDEQRRAWLECYAQQRGLVASDGLEKQIVRKARSIGRHDARLKLAQPRRNISIPPP